MPGTISKPFWPASAKLRPKDKNTAGRFIVIPPPPVPKLIAIFLVPALVAVGLVLYFFNPATHSFYPPCPLHALTGLDCPTCGGLRALHLLLHGEFRAAWAMNPFIFGAAPLVGCFLIRPQRAGLRWALWIGLALGLGWFAWHNGSAVSP